MIRSLTAALAAASCASAATGQSYGAQSYVDLAQIDRAVAAFTGAAQGDPGGAAQLLDRRLRLAPCPAQFTTSWYGTRQDTVEVRCPASPGWKLYVPLVASAAAAAATAPPVITRGDAVTISVSGAGFAVSQPGEALESGETGAWIKVRGPGANAAVLRARVLRPGLVGMELP